MLDGTAQAFFLRSRSSLHLCLLNECTTLPLVPGMKNDASVMVHVRKQRGRVRSVTTAQFSFDCLRLCCKNPAIMIQFAAARTLELRYLRGLTVEETAEFLKLSQRIVERE